MVASSQPASWKRSSVTSCSGSGPEAMTANSNFGVFFSMRAPAEITFQILGMMPAAAWRRPDADDATVAVVMGAIEPRPGMSARRDAGPAFGLGIADGSLDLLARMPWPSGHRRPGNVGGR